MIRLRSRMEEEMRRTDEDIVIIGAIFLVVMVLETQYQGILWWLMDARTHINITAACTMLAVLGFSQTTVSHPDRKKVTTVKIFLTIATFIIVYALLTASGVIFHNIHGGANVAATLIQ